MGRPTQHVVLTIHGTGAGDDRDAGERWWQLGSETCGWLERRLGPRAACSPRVFHWSGANSERERLAAGVRLLERWLRRYERAGQPYHLIGHSHGGSVIWHALQEAEARGIALEHLRSWTTVGTPFLHFLPDPTDRWLIRFVFYGPVGLVLFPGLAFVTLGSLGSLAGILAWSILWAIVIVSGLFLVILTLYSSTRAAASAVSGRLHRRRGQSARGAFGRYGHLWRGFGSTQDEAIHGLRGSLVLGGEIAGRIAHRGSLARLGRAALSPFRALRALLPARRADPEPAVVAPAEEAAGGPGPVGRRALRPAFARLFGASQSGPLDRWLAVPAALCIAVIAISAASVPSLWSASPGWPTTGLALALAGLSVMALGPAIVFAHRAFRAITAGGRRAPVDEDDEAFDPAGTSTSLLRTLMASFGLFGAVLFVLRALYNELYGPLHNRVVAPMLDELIWDRIRRKLQGNDLPGFVLGTVTAGPLPGVARPDLPTDLDADLIEQANRHAWDAVGRLRMVLCRAAVLGADLHQFSEEFGDQLTYRELVHNSYFDDARMMELLAGGITMAIEVGPPAGPPPEPDLAAVAADLEAVHRLGRARGRYRVASLAIGTLFIIVMPMVVLTLFLVLLAAIAAAVWGTSTLLTGS